MKYYYDLHIHSILSSDADLLMTPNNIMNMANLKGLQIISVTDHNSLKQIPAFMTLSESYDMLFIPGVELAVKEGYHLLVYFKSFEEAMKFDLELEPYQSQSKHHVNEDTQWIMNAYDEPMDQLPFDLTQRLTCDLDTLYQLLKNYEHLKVAAHIERPNTSMIDQIKDYQVDAVEITLYAKDFIKNPKMETLFNSDAHDLLTINEKTRKNQIDLDELTIASFFKHFKHGTTD